MSFNEENIEAFLTDKLSVSERTAMEEGMKNDPKLKNEVDFQNDIIESLKNSRKLQLKSRMNNIDVSATSTGVSSTVKIAASLITVGMIGAGIYYMSVFRTDTKDKEIGNATVMLNEVNSDQISNNEGVIITNSEIKEVKSSNKNNIRGSYSIKKESTTNSAPIVNVPNGEIVSQETALNKGVVLPNGQISEAKIEVADNVDIGIDGAIKKDLSYKFYNGKLFLSKDFEEQPYELLELNTSKSKQFYLHFGNKYYEMKSNQTKVARLNEVKDDSILLVLKNLNK